LRAAELALAPQKDVEPEAIAEAAKSTGHVAVAIEGIQEPTAVNGIKLIPRLTTRDLNMLKRFRGLRAYPVEKAENLKNYPKLKRYVHIITMTANAMRRLGPKEIDRLVNLGLPVEVQINVALEALATGSWLRGFRALLLAAMTNKIRIAVSSGAHDPLLIRPVDVKRAFLEVFGLTQSHSFEAVITVPINTLESVMRY
jgi:RNase P/RNase MRP subunit p30